MDIAVNINLQTTPLYDVYLLLEELPCTCVHGMTHAITGDVVKCRRCNLRENIIKTLDMLDAEVEKDGGWMKEYVHDLHMVVDV
jgi:hypothetical protein